MFQAANLLPWLTVRENVRLPLRVGGRHPPADKRIDDLLGMAGLQDFGGSAIRTSCRAACSSAPASAGRSRAIRRSC